MSEMSQAQGPVGGDVDFNPTDDMVPPRRGRFACSAILLRPDAGRRGTR